MKTTRAETLLRNVGLAGLLAALPLQAGEDIDVYGGPSFTEEIHHNEPTTQVANGTDFGTRNISDGPVGVQFLIHNDGDDALVIYSGDTNGSAQFSILGLPNATTSIPAGGNDVFTIWFDPTTAGQHHATVRIFNSDAGESPFEFPITGLAVGNPEIVVEGEDYPNPSEIWRNIANGDDTPRIQDGTLFLSTDVGDATTQSFRIRNTGDSNLGIFSLIDNSGHFSSSIVSANIAAGGTEEFTITFEPTIRGTHTATITLDTNDADEDPFTFNVQGTGLAPEIILRGGPTQALDIADGDTTPRAEDGTDFGDVSTAGSESVTNTFIIRNHSTGTKDLTVIDVQLSGSGASSFSISGAPGISDPIVPGAGDRFDITFDPNISGHRNATVTILSNDPDENPYTFEITGRGVSTAEIVVEGRPNQAAPWVNIAAGSTLAIEQNGAGFGERPVGSSLPHFFRVRNTGLVDLVLSNAGDGNNPHFAHSGLAAVIPAGGSDEFTITYSPTSFGTHTATFSVDNNDLNENPFTFTLNGTARAPQLQVREQNADVPINHGDKSPSPSDGTHFGSFEAGAANFTRVYRIYNVGNEVLQLGPALPLLGDHQHFEILSFPAPSTPVPPLGFVDFQVRFAPQWDGELRVTVQLSSDDPSHNPYTFDLAGTGTGEPDIRINWAWGGDWIPSSTTVDIKDTPAGGRWFASFEIWNTGNGLLNLSADLDNPLFNFAEQGPRTVVEPGEYTRFQLQFRPEFPGTESCTLNFPNDDPDEDPYFFIVRGKVTGPELHVLGGPDLAHTIPDGDSSPSPRDHTDFGELHIDGESLTRTFVLENRGDGPALLTTATISPGDFVLEGLPNSATELLPRARMEFTITCDPSSLGPRTSTVTIISDAPGDASFYTFDVTAEGVVEAGEAEIELRGGFNYAFAIPSGDSTPWVGDGTDFGSVMVGGAPVTETFRVLNLGSGTLTGLGASSSHPDIALSQLPNEIPSGGFADLDVTFTPNSPGVQNAIISVTSNDPNEGNYLFLVRLDVEPDGIVAPLSIVGIRHLGNDIELSFTTDTTGTYRVLSSKNLINWSVLGSYTGIPGTGAVVTRTLSGLGIGASRYFRVERE